MLDQVNQCTTRVDTVLAQQAEQLAQEAESAEAPTPAANRRQRSITLPESSDPPRRGRRPAPAGAH
ncbi:MAG: hypothetical protein E6R03_02940 [Hyphomicrobiaceae bacterium]|nr:MAG: hypothetical protein E6R03_02940 [Hyphomicrobiaceae bacterium]